MGQKIVVGPINKGLRTDVTAFNIDNDNFPVLQNAYQWRGRAKRKRGTINLGRLERFFNSTSKAYSSTATITLSSGSANILTGFGLEASGNIVPGSVTINDVSTSIQYTDPTMNGYLTPTGTGGNNTINYSTGVITISGGGSHQINVAFLYYPGLPGLGWEDFAISNDYPGNIAFDSVYSYNITSTFPQQNYDVSFYKNPTSSGSYVAKSTLTPTWWNGMNYQQFWTTNYQGALWATNGVTTPFDVTHVGMQYAGPSSSGVTNVISDPTYGSATTFTVTITNCPLVIGDFVFFNEWTGSNTANSQTLNFQSGYVTACSPNTPAPATKTLTVTFPNSSIANDTYTPGIIQYLTNRSDTTKDCIRWYDGDPTNGNATTPELLGIFGWVNFMPPLSQGDYSISDTPPNQYYLVGAKAIVGFKDFLLFFAPVIQTSSAGSQIYLQDTVIYSFNGTPYYTASFQGPPTNPSAITPILVPTNQTAFPSAYFEDQTGFGGFKSAALNQEINTVAPNEDVLIVGFKTIQTRLIFSGNNVDPFNFYLINSELGSGSTFSAVIMDKGILTRGSRGYIITSQVDAQRIDLDLPDQVFETQLSTNGAQRICAIRDFINEWVFFTYPTDNEAFGYMFPNQTLQWNYRDNSWAIHDECYTTYGLWRRQEGVTWSNLTYTSWGAWNDSWDSGSYNEFNPDVIGLNQQGFIMMKDEDTDEGISLSIQSFSGSVVTCLNHCLNPNDYIIINGCLGTIGQYVNGQIFQVGIIDINTFDIYPNIGSGTYYGGGTITRIYIPQIMSKQFPVAWDIGRKTRLGPQMYLFTTTPNSQITLLIFLSQNATFAYNTQQAINDSLIYSTILYTCPESTNLGLTPANTNLQMVTAQDQDQIWHRVNTSLLGDTVQVGFTLSPTQITSFGINGPPFAVTGATNAYPCVLTCAGSFDVGSMIQITGVFSSPGTFIHQVISFTSTTVTINLNSTGFGAATGSGTATAVATLDQFAEIELHGFILDVSPSMLLA